MAKLTTQDLERIKGAQKERLRFEDKTYLLICGGTGCHATGSIRVKDALVEEINAKGLNDKVDVIETGCNGFCALGPLLVVHPGDIFYEKLTVEDMPELVESHLVNGKVVERLLYKDPVSKAKIVAQTDIPFFSPPDAPGAAQQRPDQSRVHRCLYRPGRLYRRRQSIV
jgi:NADP-reducing hydrogenase subunit HndC